MNINEKEISEIVRGVLFEMGGIDEATAKEALRLAGHKLPIKTKIISKETQAGGEEQ